MSAGGTRSPTRPVTRPLVRPPFAGVEVFEDGVHYDATVRSDAGGIMSVKAPGAAARIGLMTDFFTFTGGNQSMYRGPAGLLVPSVTNAPRVEYDASGGVLGLLIEGTRTNLGLHSNDHTNAAWVKTTMTTAKTSTGPDGVVNSATRLTATGANSLSVQTVISASATRAYSVWIRRITGTGNIQLVVDGVTFNTKAITGSWARYDISQAAVTNPVFGIRIVTSGDAIDVYGNQLESAAFPSSLIPTTTIAVARTDDTAQRAAGGEISSAAGTIITELDAPVFTGFDGRMFVLDDGTGNNRFAVRASNDNWNSFTQSGGVGDGAAQIVTSITANVRAKGAAAFQLNDLSVSINGSAIVQDSSLALPIAMNRFNLGFDPSGGAGVRIFGHIRRLDYWPERKPNNFLIQRTA